MNDAQANPEECTAALNLVDSLLCGYGLHEFAGDLREHGAAAIQHFFGEAEEDPE